MASNSNIIAQLSFEENVPAFKTMIFVCIEKKDKGNSEVLLRSHYQTFGKTEVRLWDNIVKNYYEAYWGFIKDDFLNNYQFFPPEKAKIRLKQGMKQYGSTELFDQAGMVSFTSASVNNQRHMEISIHLLITYFLNVSVFCLQADDVEEQEKQTNKIISSSLNDVEKEIQELEQLLRCKVCLDSDACVVLFPCRHMATCQYCVAFLQCCPVCRSFIQEAVKINEE